MSLIQSVTDYISSCPILKDGYMHVDYLGSDPVEYAVEVLPTEVVRKRYIDGSSERQYDFAVSTRDYYSVDAVQNTENQKFFEEFQDWIEKSSRDGVLPAVEGGRAIKLEVLTSAYLFGEDEMTARYQMQLRLIYFKAAKA